jgi:hypothetical protein
MTTNEELLYSVWYAALDAAHSPNFHHEDGSLNEEAYLTYQRNVFKRVKELWSIEDVLGENY